MTGIAELFTAVNWLLPTAEEEMQGGDEECPVAAVYEIAGGFPYFMHIAFDHLHAHGYEALGNFVVDWVAQEFGRAPESTGELLYGIPIPYEGADLGYHDHRARAGTVIDFTESVLGDPDKITPASQLPLIDLSELDDPTEYDAEDDEIQPLGPCDEDGKREARRLSRLVSDYGRTAGLLFYSIWETHHHVHSVDSIWLDAACAFGWAFSATGNMSVDFTDEEIADGGYEWADWSEYALAHGAVQEALHIMKRVDPGRNAILFNPAIRRIVRENLKLAHALVKEHSHHAYQHFSELRWPSLGTAIERWADSPARHLRQRGGHPAQAPRGSAQSGERLAGA